MFLWSDQALFSCSRQECKGTIQQRRADQSQVQQSSAPADALSMMKMKTLGNTELICQNVILVGYQSIYTKNNDLSCLNVLEQYISNPFLKICSMQVVFLCPVLMLSMLIMLCFQMKTKQKVF